MKMPMLGIVTVGVAIAFTLNAARFAGLRRLLTGGCWLTALLLASPAGLGAAQPRPNILVIYTDDQGFGDAGCYNPQSRIQTPNLDKLAAEGMRFTDAHCSDSVCTPSRYSLLTGRYSWRTTLKRGVFGAERPCLIADGRMTLASLCRDNGYATAMVGKWHLGMDFPGDEGARDWTQPVKDMPLDKGFDYFFGIPASLNYGVLAWFEGRFAKVPPTEFTKKKPNQLNPGDYRIMPPYEPKLAKGLMEVAPDFVDAQCLTRFTDKAIEYIQGRAKATDGKPFFLYLPYTSPHLPVIPLERFRGKSGCGAYGDFMMETDWHIGRVLDALEAGGMTRNTLIVFSSDNGPENPWKERIKQHQHYSSGPYRDGKRSIYEGGHRVPFIVRWPEVVKPGSVWDGVVCQSDLLATFADIFGAKIPDNAGEDSVSFHGALTGKAGSKERLPVIHHSSKGRFAVREGKWKLIMEHANARRELYDLDADPGERTNIIAQHADIASRLTERITAIVQKGRTTPGADQANDTGWWDDLAWIPGKGSSPKTGKKGNKRSAADPVAR
jgi:arylsulfatase A